MNDSFKSALGCFTIVGVIFTILGVIVAIIALFKPNVVTVVLQGILPEPTSVIVVVPSHTPFLAKRPVPTNTPEPSPTPTMIPVSINTPTPIPTNTAIPSPQPTATPLPTATPISGLPVGTSYSKDGVEITLTSLQYNPDYNEFPVFFADYALTNNTQSDLLVDILMENTEIVSDTSVRWRVEIMWVENKSFPSKLLKPGEKFTWSWIYRHKWNEPIPPDARVILVRLWDVSRIDFVQWKWDIPR